MGRISFTDRSWKRRAAGGPDDGPFLAYLVRESRTLADAIRRWMAERPPVLKPSPSAASSKPFAPNVFVSGGSSCRASTS